jgi:hypothetical protein
MARINAKTRKALNVSIAYWNTSNTRKFKGIPVDDIDQTLQLSGFTLIQEDGAPWSGMLCGDDSHCTIDLATNELDRIENSVLSLSWHRFDSGNYEIVAYIS